MYLYECRWILLRIYSYLMGLFRIGKYRYRALVTRAVPFFRFTVIYHSEFLMLGTGWARGAECFRGFKRLY